MAIDHPIPKNTLLAIEEWIALAPHPDTLGSFVRAVLTNDLREAVGQADEENLANLKNVVNWIYWNVPSGAWGSREKMLAYHERKKKMRSAA